MTTVELNEKWNTLSGQTRAGAFRILRISQESIPELYLGIDQEGLKCFLLRIERADVIKLRKQSRENITIQYHKEKKFLVVKLLDPFYLDLFNELITSLYYKIFNIEENKKCTEELITLYYKWIGFFEGKSSSELSMEEVKGIFGELIFLHQLIENEDPDINQLLESWKGPYGTPQDFILPERNVEVKTKEKNQTEIKISSEYQLEPEDDKDLELAIIDVEFSALGLAIEDVFNDITTQVRKLNGDLSILYTALRQKGITKYNIKDLNNFRFQVEGVKRYDCNAENFPKLSKSLIPNQIKNLRYSLPVSKLNEFLISA